MKYKTLKVCQKCKHTYVNRECGCHAPFLTIHCTSKEYDDVVAKEQHQDKLDEIRRKCENNS